MLQSEEFAAVCGFIPGIRDNPPSLFNGLAGASLLMVERKSGYGLKILLCLWMAVSALSNVSAQPTSVAYPAREVQIVVPNEPGGGLDLVARLLAKNFTTRLAQPFVVINRSGASGNIGTASVARAEPNGYTLLLTGVGHLVSPLLHGQAGYDPLRDFEPVAKIASAPNVLLVHESLKRLTLKQLLADPRSRSGGFSYGTAGYGHSSHLAAEVFKARVGSNWLHVPYRGTGPATRALMAGEVQLMFVPAGSVQTLLASGRVHAVAVAHSHRLDTFASIPTFAELGLPGVEFSQWYGLFAPAGTSAAALNVLQGAALSFAADGEGSQQLRSLGLEPTPMARATMAEFLADQSRRLSTLVRQQNVEGAVN